MGFTLKLWVIYLLFYIRHIAWCIFIRFVKKRIYILYISEYDVVFCNWCQIGGNSKVKVKCVWRVYKLFKNEKKRQNSNEQTLLSPTPWWYRYYRCCHTSINLWENFLTVSTLYHSWIKYQFNQQTDISSTLLNSLSYTVWTLKNKNIIFIIYQKDSLYQCFLQHFPAAILNPYISNDEKPFSFDFLHAFVGKQI